MNISAIIAEYNPFHNGHMYLAETARRQGADCIISVMSGNWVQRGDAAVISKFARARQALECGVDLVAELPTYWAMSTAQKFAAGAAEIVENLGADTLVFGSECGDIERIIRTVYCIRSSSFSSRLRELLDAGTPLAKSRETAVQELCGNGDILRSPNDTLAVEYINALKSLNSKMKFSAVKRLGAGHNSTEAQDGICPAGMLRKLIKEDKLDIANKYMPAAAFEILQSEYGAGHTADIDRLEKTILTALRTGSPEKFKALPDISEGIENRLFNAARLSSTISQFMDFASTKRYTNARLRRLILSAFLNIKATDIPDRVPYIRILGCNQKGADALQAARTHTKIPIIMRSTSLKDDPVFKFESTATDVYSLAQNNPSPCGEEFTNGIIIKR